MCLSTAGVGGWGWGWGAIPACIAGGIPACLAAGVQGEWYPSMPCRFPGPHPRGKLRGIWSRPTPKGPGGVCSGGGCLHQGVPARGGGGDPPWQLLLRAVRILLECILVLGNIHSKYSLKISNLNSAWKLYLVRLTWCGCSIIAVTRVNPWVLTEERCFLTRNLTFSLWDLQRQFWR